MNRIFAAITEGSPPILDGYAIHMSALNCMAEQRGHLIADDWEALGRLANQGLGQASGAYRQMRRDFGILEANKSAANTAFASTLESYAKDGEDREEFFAKIKEEILAAAPDTNQATLDALQALSEGTVTGNPLLKSLKTNAQERGGERSAIDATVALAVRSLTALTHAGFHHHHGRLAEFDFTPFPEEYFDELKGSVTSFGDDLEYSLKKLHGDLLLGRSPGLATEELVAMLEESLPKFGRLQATLRLYAAFLRNAGKGTASEKVGNVAALAGDMTRYAFAAHAASYRLSLEDKASHQTSKARKVVVRATQLAFDIDFPDGKNTEISKVDQLDKGDYVEVAGFVETIAIGKDNDNKLITQVTLRDPSSNTSVVAAARFVHLRHIGLLEGAYCRLSGTWQPSSGMNKGDSAVEIEKLSINQLALKSWKILFLDLADKYVDRWPGGFNIQYGLSPHLSAADDDGESEILGAGELIFRPFIR